MHVDVCIMPNKLDQFYRSLVLTKYFTKGWGKPENLKRICEFRKIVSDRETCYKLVPPDYPVTIEREIDTKNYSLFNGYFFTPFAHYLPEVVPVECQKAYFQLILPKTWKSDNYKPVVLQIAGTGDQYYWRRRNLIAKPLLREAGIGSIILENPFYGRRKPTEQRRTVLQNVSDIFVMGGCLILESMVLFHFCERLGYGPLGVTGLSMGGHMASLAASCWPKPIIVVPCLSGLTASNVFTQGVISRALNWDMLEKQLDSSICLKEEILKMINFSEGDAFRAGQKFMKSISEKEHNYDYSDNMLRNFTHKFNDSANTTVTDTQFQKYNNLNSMDVSQSQITQDLLASENHRNDNESRLREIAENDRNYSHVWFRDIAQNYKRFLFKTKNVEYNRNHMETSRPSSLDVNALQNEATHSESRDRFYLLHSLIELIAHPISSVTSVRNAAENLVPFETILSNQQTLNFMNGIMDECTHLKNYPVPVDTSLVIAVCAEDDAYVLEGVSRLNEIWPGAEVRYVKGGHVRAYVQCQQKFRSAIIDAFSRYRSKYTKDSELYEQV